MHGEGDLRLTIDRDPRLMTARYLPPTLIKQVYQVSILELLEMIIVMKQTARLIF